MPFIAGSFSNSHGSRRYKLFIPSGDDRRFALISPLIGRVEPIPASSLVCRFGLLGIQNDDALLRGDRIHSRAEREIIGIL